MNSMYLSIPLVASAVLLGGCDSIREWEEQVRLHDGRVVVLKRTAVKEFTAALGDAPYRHKESRLALDEPVNIRWRGDIRPIAFDLYGSDAYVVIDLIGRGGPCERYGNPNPPFVYFRSMDGIAWVRVGAAAVPSTLRRNLLLNWDRPEIGRSRQPLSVKDKQALDAGAAKELLEFSPSDTRRQRFC